MYCILYKIKNVNYLFGPIRVFHIYYAAKCIIIFNNRSV
jgi:hypothetical protein